MQYSKTIKRAMDYVNQMLVPLEQHYYHQYNHALEVMDRSVYLAEKEGLNEKEIEILMLASLFHDTGFVIQYDKNEPIGAKIARNYLKSMLYHNEDIQLIEEIILATDPEYTNPKNIYEKIIKDADLDNLGRDDFLDKSESLNREIEAIKNIKVMEPNWQHGVINFLAEHKYYTDTQIEEREEKKEFNRKQLEKMVQDLENEEI